MSALFLSLLVTITRSVLSIYVYSILPFLAFGERLLPLSLLSLLCLLLLFLWRSEPAERDLLLLLWPLPLLSLLGEMYQVGLSCILSQSVPSFRNCSTLYYLSYLLPAVFAAFGIVLKLHFDWLAIEGALVISLLLDEYARTHSSADPRSFMSTKAKQYSELRFLLATMLATYPYF